MLSIHSLGTHALRCLASPGPVSGQAFIDKLVCNSRAWRTEFQRRARIGNNDSNNDKDYDNNNDKGNDTTSYSDNNSNKDDNDNNNNNNNNNNNHHNNHSKSTISYNSCNK